MMVRRFALAAAALLFSTAEAQRIQPPPATDLANGTVQPFADHAKANVLVFVRTDCPITNRYAPELKRIAAEFAGQRVEFWLVYADRSETPGDIHKHIAAYGFPGTPLRDPRRALARYAQAKVAPEAAVFDSTGSLRYHGRIDNQWVSFGQSRQQPTRHDLEIALTEVLDGKPVSEPETKAIGCYLADLQ